MFSIVVTLSKIIEWIRLTMMQCTDLETQTLFTSLISSGSQSKEEIYLYGNLSWLLACREGVYVQLFASPKVYLPEQRSFAH